MPALPLNGGLSQCCPQSQETRRPKPRAAKRSEAGCEPGSGKDALSRTQVMDVFCESGAVEDGIEVTRPGKYIPLNSNRGVSWH